MWRRHGDLCSEWKRCRLVPKGCEGGQPVSRSRTAGRGEAGSSGESGQHCIACGLQSGSSHTETIFLCLFGCLIESFSASLALPVVLVSTSNPYKFYILRLFLFLDTMTETADCVLAFGDTVNCVRHVGFRVHYPVQPVSARLYRQNTELNSIHFEKDQFLYKWNEPWKHHELRTTHKIKLNNTFDLVSSPSRMFHSSEPRNRQTGKLCVSKKHQLHASCMC